MKPHLINLFKVLRYLFNKNIFITVENNKEIISEVTRMRELIGFKNQINEIRHPRIRIKKGKRRTLIPGKSGKSDYVDFEDYSVETPESEWDSFLSNDGAMVKLMDEDSKTNWNKLKTDPNHKDYAVASLEEFNRTYPTYKWTKVNVGDESKIDTTIIPGQVKQFPAVPIKFPADLTPSSNFFKDNYYEVTDLFKQTVKTDIIDPVVAQMASMKQPAGGKSKAALASLSVLSSCSTLPNGPSPDGKTYSFEELSRLRNETAKNYVLAQLKAIGVEVMDNAPITQSYLGSNKNGTSGPQWDSKWSKEVKTQKKPEFEKYKYLDMDLEIVFNMSSDPTTMKEPDQIITIESDIYDVSFVAPGRKSVTFRLPKITIDMVGRRRRKSKKKKFRLLDCPKW
jgi:hypothetical protein